MITQEDYETITKLDSSSADEKRTFLEANRAQSAKAFLNLLGYISKDQTIQYILIMIDDMLNEDKSRVEIFREHAKKKKESPWTPFLNLLNRNDEFIKNMTARIIAKLACWSQQLMDGADLHYYLTWTRDQLKVPGKSHATL